MLVVPFGHGTRVLGAAQPAFTRSSGARTKGTRPETNQLKNRQEFLQFVRRNLHPVILKLLALELQEPCVDVLAQSFVQELGVLSLPYSLTKVAGQVLYAEPL